MSSIRVATTIPAPPDVVWADVSDITTHTEWMHDAEAIEFLTEDREGVGATFDCRTRIGRSTLR